MWSALSASVLKNGSCAMGNREPCQVGNQAALSGPSHVPQGRLFGAETAVNACNVIDDYRVYDLIGRPSCGGVSVCRIARNCPFLFTITKAKEAEKCIRRYIVNGVRPILILFADKST